MRRSSHWKRSETKNTGVNFSHEAKQKDVIFRLESKVSRMNTQVRIVAKFSHESSGEGGDWERGRNTKIEKWTNPLECVD